MRICELLILFSSETKVSAHVSSLLSLMLAYSKEPVCSSVLTSILAIVLFRPLFLQFLL